MELCSLFGSPGDIPIPVELTAEHAEPQATEEDGMNDMSGEDDEAAGAGNAQQIRSSGAVGVDPSTSTSSTGAVGVDPSTSTSSTGAVGLDPSTSTMDSAQNLVQALQCASDAERPELLRRFGMIQDGDASTRKDRGWMCRSTCCNNPMRWHVCLEMHVRAAPKLQPHAECQRPLD